MKTLLVPWQTGLKATWTVSSLRSALIQQRQGQLALSSQLFDSLLEDDEFPGTLARRVNATLEAPFCFKTIEAYGEKPKLSKRELKVQGLFPEMCPDDELFDMIANWLIMGVGIGTIDWDTSGSVWMPKLRALPSEFAYYDHDARCWKYQVRDQAEMIVTPGDGKWVLFTHGQRGWIWGLLRGLALTWLGKQMAFCDWQRYSQKHGLPIFRAKIPIWRDDAEKTKFVEELGTLVSEGIIGLPQDENSAGQTSGYDVDLLEATTVSWQGFEAALARADRKMQVQLLGGNLGAEATSKGSNRAAAETHAGELQKLAGGDQKRIGRALREQLLRPFYQLNYAGASDVPLPYWDANPIYDARAWVPAQAQFATTVKTLAEAGVGVKNLEESGRAVHLELEYEVTVTEKQEADQKVNEAKAKAAAQKPAAGAKPKAKGQKAAKK